MTNLISVTKLKKCFIIKIKLTTFNNLVTYVLYTLVQSLSCFVTFDCNATIGLYINFCKKISYKSVSLYKRYDNITNVIKIN